MRKVNKDRHILAYEIPRTIGLYASPDACEKIYSAYVEQWRTYHNASHIVDMYTTCSAIIDHIDPDNLMWRNGIRLMIFYHDVWYKVGREFGLNENMSAEWALSDCGQYLENQYQQALHQGIKATATHTLENVDPEYHKEVELLLDLDLKCLGLPLPDFQVVTEAIWGEYEPVATREEYDTGRAQWAQSLLERTNIYHTDWFLEKFEKQARKNLRALLQ